nr:cell surface protein [Rickettsia massiliae]
MFASTAALMLASTSALGTANRIVTVGGGSVADGSAFGRGAYVPGSFVTFGEVNNFTSDVSAIPAIYLDTFNNATMTVPNNITLGPVIPVDLTKENVRLVVDVPNAINITLTGTPVTNAQALAAVSPFAPGPGEAPGNTYYFNSFNFNDLASTLIFQATSLLPPTGDNRIAFISQVQVV